MFEWFTSPVRIERKLDEVLRLLNVLQLNQNRQGKKLMADLSRITAAISVNNSAVDSAVILIKQIAEALRNAGSDQAAVDALAADLEAKAAELAAAVVENTPAA